MLMVAGCACLGFLAASLYHSAQRRSPTRPPAAGPLYPNGSSSGGGTPIAFPRRRGRVFVAANFFNSGALLPQFSRELLALCDALGYASVFVSIYENGSGDDTALHLYNLNSRLAHLGVERSVVSEQAHWRTFCSEVLTGEALTHCLDDGCSELRECGEAIRIPIMAAIRNRALRPLAAYRAADVTLLFINDVLLERDDMLALLDTNGGSYDMACGMDFEGLKLYDTWVARDLSGATLSEWYPFVREATSQALLREGLPFRVYSCWNGAVALRLAAEEPFAPSFRSWAPSENRSPRPPDWADGRAAAAAPAGWVSSRMSRSRTSDPTKKHCALTTAAQVYYEVTRSISQSAPSPGVRGKLLRRVRVPAAVQGHMERGARPHLHESSRPVVLLPQHAVAADVRCAAAERCRAVVDEPPGPPAPRAALSRHSVCAGQRGAVDHRSGVCRGRASRRARASRVRPQRTRRAVPAGVEGCEERGRVAADGGTPTKSTSADRLFACRGLRFRGRPQ